MYLVEPIGAMIPRLSVREVLVRVKCWSNQRDEFVVHVGADDEEGRRADAQAGHANQVSEPYVGCSGVFRAGRLQVCVYFAQLAQTVSEVGEFFIPFAYYIV